MTANTRRHHYIPKNILWRFCDEADRLFLLIKAFRRIVETTPLNAFHERDLNSLILDDGSLDDSLEKEFAKVDANAKFLIDYVEPSVLRGRYPPLDDETRGVFDQIWYNLWKRTPEFHRAPLEEHTSAHNILTTLDRIDALPQEKAEIREKMKSDAYLRGHEAKHPGSDASGPVYRGAARGQLHEHILGA